MDEFSDFQMAVTSSPAPSPRAQKENHSSPTGKGFHWGINQKQQSPKLIGGNFPTAPQRSQFSEQQQSIQIGPTSSSASNQKKVDKNVGSRLANYDLGRKPQSTNNGVYQQQQGFSYNVPTPTNHSLLIGEEDKYAALRALEVTDETPTALFSSTTIPEKKQCAKESLMGMPTLDTEVGTGGDDFSDFGDFQSFSNPSSIHSTAANVSTTANGFKNTGFINLASNSQNGLPPPQPPSIVSASGIPQFDFGDFVSVPEPPVVPTSFSDNQNEIRDLNHSVLSHELSSIFIADPPSPDSTNLSTDWEDMSSLNFCDRDVMPNYADMPLGLDSSSDYHLHSSNNNGLPWKNSFQQNMNNGEAAPSPAACYIEDNLQNNLDIESATIVSSNIPSPEDLRVLPASFIKTSLIGCDVGRISSDIENLESIRSASLMETNNDLLEYIPSHEKNRFDISPETRSIASLDLGNYCPTFDPPECKTSSDNMWNDSMSSVISCSNSSKQPQLERGDSLDTTERGSNQELMSDKYQCFREDLQTEANVHELTWSRCLETVKQIINAAVEIFGAVVSDSSTLLEVLFSDIGENYINCLFEVYQVGSRIKLSQNQGCRSDKDKLKSVCAEVDSLWESLGSMFIGTDAMEKLHSSRTTTETVSCYGESKRCGICLCFLDDVQFNCVEYDDVLYHSGCANLWINNVETRLPSLSASGMQLDEIVTYQNTCH